MGFKRGMNGLACALKHSANRTPARLPLPVTADGRSPLFSHHHKLYSSHTPEEDHGDQFCSHRE